MSDTLLKAMAQDFLDEFANDFSEWRTDPVGFIEQVLGETLTPDLQALAESVRDVPFTVARSSNAVGKTWLAARLAIWFYLSYSESQVYTTSAPPEANLRRLLWGEIMGIVERHVDLFRGHNIKTLQIARSAQSFLVGTAIPSSGTPAAREARFSGKHAPALMFVVDEADAVANEIFKGIQSCLSGGFPRFLAMYNPRFEGGEVYRMERDGQARVVCLSAFGHPNVISGRDEIAGAVTRETTVRRINEWSRPLASGEAPGAEDFELPGFLVGATAKSQAGKEYPPLKAGYYKIMEPAFSYMVLGVHPTQSSTALISKEWIAQARHRWDTHTLFKGDVPPVGASGVMGLDVAEFGTDANAAAFRYGGYVERLICWTGLDTLQTAERAAQEYQVRNIQHACIDATGIGAGVSPTMVRSNCVAIPVKVGAAPTRASEMGRFNCLRDQLWWMCREWLRTDPNAMLPPDEQLIEELSTPTYEVQNGAIRVMKKDTMRELLKRSPDRADALCLTFMDENFLIGGM